MTDPESLQIIFSLASRVEPDWISAFHVIKPAQKPGITFKKQRLKNGSDSSFFSDIVVGVSNAGMVKIWSLSSTENKVDPKTAV